MTAGASAPDQRVQDVITAVAPRDGVELVRVTDEDEYFPLPPQLRRFMQTLQALVEGSVACRTPGEPGPIERDREFSATEALTLLGPLSQRLRHHQFLRFPSRQQRRQNQRLLVQMGALLSTRK